MGEGHRSNMAGYLTAGAVSQDAFNVAMADLMSSLSAVQATAGLSISLSKAFCVEVLVPGGVVGCCAKENCQQQRMLPS